MEHSERLSQLQEHFDLKSAEADDECFTREKYGFLERRLHSMIANDQVRTGSCCGSHDHKRGEGSSEESVLPLWGQYSPSAVALTPPSPPTLSRGAFSHRPPTTHASRRA